MLPQSLVHSEGFVGGCWVKVAATFPIQDLAIGAELAQVVDCGGAEAQAAVRAAYEAGATWGTISAKATKKSNGWETFCRPACEVIGQCLITVVLSVSLHEELKPLVSKEYKTKSMKIFVDF